MSYLVRQKGGYALKFHRNLQGPVYRAVADAEATTFESVTDATRSAVIAGMRVGTFTIENLPLTTQHRREAEACASCVMPPLNHGRVPAVRGAL